MTTLIMYFSEAFDIVLTTTTEIYDRLFAYSVYVIDFIINRHVFA